MGERQPGSICITQIGENSIDQGTMCRASSSLPGPSGAHRGPVSTSERTSESAYVIYLYNNDLARVSQVFTTIRPGWTQRVEVIYTEGKADRVWADAGIDVITERATKGITVAATVRENAKHLNGIVAIDFTFVGPKSGDSELRERKLGLGLSVAMPTTLKERRERLFVVLTHELLHILQGWVHGDEWGRMYTEAMRDAIRHGPVTGEPISGYANRYELAAFTFGENWVRENRERLAAGEFDNLIPISALKANP